MRLFGKVNGFINRFDRPHFLGDIFDLEWTPIKRLCVTVLATSIFSCVAEGVKKLSSTVVVYPIFSCDITSNEKLSLAVSSRSALEGTVSFKECS